MGMVNYPVPSSKTSLLPALAKSDKIAVAKHLQAFKDRGVIRYDKTLHIPSIERIPALIKSERVGYDSILTLITASLQNCFQGMNLRKGMNEDQLIDLAEMIIDEAHEDNLSMEDVLLFLQQLVTGKAGKIFDRMDIPVFFELFESYRQERHLALRYIQYEAECNYKALGDTTRTSDGLVENDANTIKVMSEYYKKTMNESKSDPVQQAPTP